jgi:pimeloyl-ACP methyl ester carboxylesterase
MVRISGCRLHYEAFGGGLPVLLVHGFPLAGEMWRESVRELGLIWRCIVPDLRGHGRSETSPDVSIARFSDDLVELLAAVGERRPVVLVGLSMGGVIALEFFRRHRSRLRALVLANARATAETPEGAAKREELAQQVLRAGSGAAADAMVDNLFAPDAPPSLKNWCRELITRNPPAGVAAAARALIARPDSMDTLAKIDCPTLIIAGDRDAITAEALMRDLHTRIPGADFALIRGAGHLTPVEQPVQFAAALRAFLQKIP